MDNQLLSLIHNYTEDREIDWTSAKVIGEQYGKVFKTEDDLREWKYLIDSYLKTFKAEDFQKVEEACKKKVNKKKKKVEEGRTERGKQDGTGPYKGSTRKEKGPTAGDQKGMAQVLIDKGLAKSKKQADFLCKRYQDPKTGKVDVKKLENDIKKKERGQAPRKRKVQQSESKRNLDNFFKD